MPFSRFDVELRKCVSRFIVYGALTFALVLMFSVVAPAQDDYRVTYFDNNNNGVANTTAPEAFIHILNPGNGAVCATIYVWRNDQELSECCSCPISNNGLLTLRVDQLTSNPGDHAPGPTSGSIAIVADGTCDPTKPSPTPDLRVWATHVNVDAAAPGGFDVTETEAPDTPFSSGESSEASGRCGFLRSNGSGHGTCDDACSTPI